MELSVRGEIAIIKFTGGENRLTTALLEQLLSYLDQVESNESIKALLTTGEGRFYSNGINLEWLAAESLHGYRQFWTKFNRVIVRLLTFPMPTVAAINGHAFAGGAFLALAHDVRVMRRDRGWLSLNEVFFSARFPVFLMELIREKCPSGSVRRDLTVLGLRLGGEECVSRGLVDDVSSVEDLLPTCLTLVRKYYQKQDIPRQSLAQMKKDVYRSVLLKEALLDTLADGSSANISRL